MCKHVWNYIKGTRAMLPLTGEVIHREACAECGKTRLVKE